jgi:hypothetical protein
MSTSVAEPRAALRKASAWPQYPSVYEINTWVWLSELSRKYGVRADLSCVRPADWDAIASLGFNAVWFMGVWERSPAGLAIANQDKTLCDDFRRALPDFRPEDNTGSPYCVRCYVVDEMLGGPEGLAEARQQLSKRGINLILDFVPNHVAPDHPWVKDHPDFFIHGSARVLGNDPVSHIQLGGKVLACGRDPYFPAWPDVVQLNAFEPALRRAAIKTIATIAEQCDGVRCDMAMLFLNTIFERTWSGRTGPRPATEYWSELISATKKTHPGFLFIAEAYWDMEWELQQQGFDFCYDKKLYDRLEHCEAESIRLHLCADLAYQGKLLRFIENHDEPRAASVFSRAKHRAVALTIATLPGTKLFHEGEFDGRKVRLPVFLGRRPPEVPDPELRDFYSKLLHSINRAAFHDGYWELCERTGWPDNSTYQNLLAWGWFLGDEFYLIVVNHSDSPSQARIRVPVQRAAGARWQMIDLLSDSLFERDGNEITSEGLHVELGPWNYHFLQCVRNHDSNLPNH